jgi:hypothetical protein
MMDRPEIIEEWEQFEGMVLSPAADETQRAEMKLAFVSGLFSGLGLLREAMNAAASADRAIFAVTRWAALHSEAMEACRVELELLEARSKGSVRP